MSQPRHAGPERVGGRVPWIDVARGAAMLMIVIGHAYLPWDGHPTAFTFIYAFHVPAFFLLSGLVHRTRGRSLTAWLRGRVRTILVPYLTWALVSVVLFDVVGGLAAQILHRRGPTSLSQDLWGIVWANPSEHLMDWNKPLWFLPAITVAYLLATGVERLGVELARVPLPVWILASVGLSWWTVARTTPALPWSLERVVVLMPFFLIGAWLRGPLLGAAAGRTGGSTRTREATRTRGSTRTGALAPTGEARVGDPAAEVLAPPALAGEVGERRAAPASRRAPGRGQASTSHRAPALPDVPRRRSHPSTPPWLEAAAGTACWAATALIAFSQSPVDYVTKAYGESYPLFLLGALTGSGGLVLLARSLPRPWGRWLERVGRDSLIILCLHKFVVIALQMVLGRVGAETWPVPSSLWALGVALVTVGVCHAVAVPVRWLAPWSLGLRRPAGDAAR